MKRRLILLLKTLTLEPATTVHPGRATRAPAWATRSGVPTGRAASNMATGCAPGNGAIAATWRGNAALATTTVAVAGANRVTAWISSQASPSTPRRRGSRATRRMALAEGPSATLAVWSTEIAATGMASAVRCLQIVARDGESPTCSIVRTSC